MKETRFGFLPLRTIMLTIPWDAGIFWPTVACMDFQMDAFVCTLAFLIELFFNPFGPLSDPFHVFVAFNLQFLTKSIVLKHLFMYLANPSPSTT